MGVPISYSFPCHREPGPHLKQVRRDGPRGLGFQGGYREVVRYLWITFRGPGISLRQGVVMPRRVVRFEFDDGNDVEFIPSKNRIDVYLNGVRLDALAPGEKPSELRALYYHDVYAEILPQMLGASPPESSVTLAC